MLAKKQTMIYVPGIKPKPPVDEHHAMLWRCLLDGVRRADRTTAGRLAQHKEEFDLVGWTEHFYSDTRDLAIDLPGIERILSMDGPDARDVRESLHWHKQIGRLVYLACDAFPVLIDWVASPEMKENLQDTRRYFRNENKLASKIREMVTERIKRAWAAGHQIMLIGHSLGSVIAYDALWELSRRENSDVRIDCFVTIGSPLGLNFVQHRMLSAREKGARRYPDNIRHWVNLSAIGEMTALDRVFADDYGEMLDLGLVESITDHMDLVNYFRGPEGLNVHRCYGYMVNEKTGAVIADWWRKKN